MITNENDFIGIMMKYKYEQDICDVRKIIELSGMTDIQFLSFIQSLSDKQIIRGLDTCYIQINPVAYSIYESQKESRKIIH